ncbi:MAG TPA: xanthine dehydrogenase family protein molybdopterin-binding subunit [Deferrisomatales bacterium]|nr:xanthine dehydrogenase family protein molybdopterin-binding subunit [Deferrisomatales bacterium]
MASIVSIDRRDFIKTGVMVGGGLVLGTHLLSRRAWAAAAPGRASVPPDPNAWIRIGPDDGVTVVVHHSEMGQGVYTSIPMLVAEELEVEWSKVRFEAAPVAAVYNHPWWGAQGTGGSTSIPSSWEPLRKVGATARTMLIAAAAAEWGVPARECAAENGRVVHRSSGRTERYGALAGKAARLPVPTEVALKDPKQFKIIGKPMPRLDTPEKVQGTGRFGIDVALPGMLTAVIQRAPSFGGKVKSFDAQKARGVPGVRAVAEVPSGVAVIADGYHAASAGRDALRIEWQAGPEPDLSSDALRKRYASLAQQPGSVARKDGDPAAALAGSAKTLTVEYEVPFLAHATMEPLNCVVDLRADRCEIWTGTQMQTGDRAVAAAVAGLPPEKVQLHTTLLGGGFGRRANPASDFVAEAVHVAKVAKAPVKLVWSREDDTRGGYYRPYWFDRISGAVDGAGKPVAWLQRIVGQSIMAGTAFEAMGVKDGIDQTSVEGAADLPYAIPNVQVELHSPRLPVPVLWWRSVGHSHTAFVVESFLDELAAAAGKDPYGFRRALLTHDPRRLAVLDLAARRADWGGPAPTGRHRGIAVHKSFGSYVAQVAEISVDGKGRVRVHRVVCAVDCGTVVNPDTVAAQMEGAIIFGLSAALYGEITFQNGQVREANFDDYPVARLSDSPEIEVHIVPSEAPPSGVGEPGLPPIAPAVANAVFAATGTRVRRLPLTPARVRPGSSG